MMTKMLFNVEETFDRSFTIKNRCFASATMQAISAVLSQLDGCESRFHETALAVNAWSL
jgi:hypothetical protein